MTRTDVRRWGVRLRSFDRIYYGTKPNGEDVTLQCHSLLAGPNLPVTHSHCQRTRIPASSWCVLITMRIQSGNSPRLITTVVTPQTVHSLQHRKFISLSHIILPLCHLEFPYSRGWEPPWRHSLSLETDARRRLVPSCFAVMLISQGMPSCHGKDYSSSDRARC